jgi:hypothetical protein
MLGRGLSRRIVMNPWRTSTFALAAVVGVLVVHTAIAGVGSLSSVSGQGVTRTKIVRSSMQASTSSTTFVPIPGAETTISVPPGTRAIIKVEFFARSFCFGVGTPSCAVRIRIGGSNAHPNNWDEPFDRGGTDDVAEAHATQGSSNVLGPGSYTVRVHWKADDAANSFSIGGFSMSAERIRV